MKDSFLLCASDITVEYRYEISSPEDRAHCYDEYEILCVLGGVGKYIVEGTEYEVRPRSVFLIKPFEYRVSELDTEAPYECYSVRFPKSALTNDALLLLRKITDKRDGGTVSYNGGSVSATVFSVFDRFALAQNLPEKESEVYIRALLSELIVLLSVSVCESVTHTDDVLGAEVVKYLNTYIDRNISLDKLARRFFISKYHLCRAFKAYSGVSVHSYVRHKRIMYAKQLIESGETAQRAADRVGFGDYSAFYRAYVKIVGRSPSTKGREEGAYELSYS